MSIHLQSIPFIVAFFLWYFLENKKPSGAFYIFLLCVGATFPYILGLGQLWGSFPIRARLSNNSSILTPFLFISSIVRFWGIDFSFLIADIKTAALELWSSYISLLGKLLLSFSILFAYYKNRYQTIGDPILNFAVISTCVYFLFSLLTNSFTESWEMMMFWWCTPILIAYGIKSISSIQYKLIFTVLICLNVFFSLTQYSSRLYWGTRVSFPHGASWWMQKEIVHTICKEAKLYYKKIGNPLSVYVSVPTDQQLLSNSLVGMTAIVDPTCFGFWQFTKEFSKSNISIVSDRNIYLRVIPTIFLHHPIKLS